MRAGGNNILNNWATVKLHRLRERGIQSQYRISMNVRTFGRMNVKGRTHSTWYQKDATVARLHRAEIFVLARD